MRVLVVLGSATGGIGEHVRSLTAGLVARGVDVTVCAPQETGDLFGFAQAGARFRAVEIGPAPRTGDVAVVRALREAASRVHVVHAHGLRAGLLSASALGRRHRPGRTPLVLTLHNAVLGDGPKAGFARVMEGRAVRGADVVLGASADLVARARHLGAHDARLGPVAAPVAAPAVRERDEVRAEFGADVAGVARPVVLAVGRLAPQKAYPVLLDAAVAWRGLTPRPLVVIAGDGPEREAMQERIDAEDLPVRLLGHRTDVPDLMAAADVAVLPSRWEARSLVAQEALRAGVPLVATAVGGIPELVGDAAVLVPFGDADALAGAVAGLLADDGRRDELAGQGRAQAATWPVEADTVAQVLSVYEELGPS